jgi:hypothetical protein
MFIIVLNNTSNQDHSFPNQKKVPEPLLFLSSLLAVSSFCFSYSPLPPRLDCLLLWHVLLPARLGRSLLSSSSYMQQSLAGAQQIRPAISRAALPDCTSECDIFRGNIHKSSRHTKIRLQWGRVSSIVNGVDIFASFQRLDLGRSFGGNTDYVCLPRFPGIVGNAIFMRPMEDKSV